MIRNTTELLKKLEQERIYLLENLVNINSVTQNVEGVRKVQNIVASYMEDLGFDVRWKISKQDGNKSLLICELLSDYSSNDNVFISFIAHADTVLGPTKNYNFSLDKYESKYKGPGVADNKGGLVSIMTVLKGLLLDNPKFNLGLRLIVSPNEEEGSLGLHDVLKFLGQDSRYVFGMEPAQKDGSLITSRNGNRWYSIKIEGRPSHAGRFDDPYVNAAHEMAFKITRLQSLNNFERKMKLNVGSIRAGKDKFNITCGQAQVLIDTRFPCLSTREEMHEQILKILEENHVFCHQTNQTCKTSFSIDDDCPPMYVCEYSEQLADKLANMISHFETFKPGLSHSGGAADINYLKTQKNLCIDGCGPVGSGLHTRNEYIEVDSLHSRARAMTQLLTYINEIEGDNSAKYYASCALNSAPFNSRGYMATL